MKCLRQFHLVFYILFLVPIFSHAQASDLRAFEFTLDLPDSIPGNGLEVYYVRSNGIELSELQVRLDQEQKLIRISGWMDYIIGVEFPPLVIRFKAGMASGISVLHTQVLRLHHFTRSNTKKRPVLKLFPKCDFVIYDIDKLKEASQIWQPDCVAPPSRYDESYLDLQKFQELISVSNSYWNIKFNTSTAFFYIGMDPPADPKLVEVFEKRYHITFIAVSGLIPAEVKEHNLQTAGLLFSKFGSEWRSQIPAAVIGISD